MSGMLLYDLLAEFNPDEERVTLGWSSGEMQLVTKAEAIITLRCRIEEQRFHRLYTLTVFVGGEAWEHVARQIDPSDRRPSTSLYWTHRHQVELEAKIEVYSRVLQTLLLGRKERSEDGQGERDANEEGREAVEAGTGG